MLDDLHAGKQHLQVRGDELFDRQELGLDRILRDDNEARDVVGNLHPGEPIGPALEFADEDGQVQRQPGDIGEWVGRVDRQRSEDGEHLRPEVVGETVLLVVVEGFPADEADPLGGQGRCDVFGEAVRMAPGELTSCLGQTRDGGAGRRTVRGRRLQAHLDASLEPAMRTM